MAVKGVKKISTGGDVRMREVLFKCNVFSECVIGLIPEIEGLRKARLMMVRN